MAVTKIWTIKDSLQRVLDYAANPDKTEYDALAQTLHYAENDAKTKLSESAQLVTGIHCRPDHAWEDMRAVQERFGKTDGVVALHAYQSFREGEVTPEQCHEIGVALARKVWGKRFQVLVATHMNTDNLHNHFVINSVSYVDGKKYEQRRSQYAEFRAASDKLCREYGLSVVEQPRSKEPARYARMREAIDQACEDASTPEDFHRALYRQGYIFGSDPHRKYATIRARDGGRAVRLYRLGEEYDLPAIDDRLRGNYLLYGPRLYERKHPPRQNTPKRYRPQNTYAGKGVLQIFFEVFFGKSQMHRLYLYYCYQLGILPKKQHPCINRPELERIWKDTEKILAEHAFVHDHKFPSLQAIMDYRKSLSQQMETLTAQRAEVVKQMRRKDAPPELADRRARLTCKIAELRKEDKIAEGAIKRIQRTRESNRITVPSSVPKRGIQQYVMAEAERIEKKFKYGVEESDQTHFEQYAENWLKRQEPFFKATTYAGYKRNLDIVYPLIGGIPLAKLLPMTLEEMCEELRKRPGRGGNCIKETTVQKYLETVSSVLEDAKKNDIIPFNPAHRVRKKHFEKEVQHIPQKYEMGKLMRAIQNEPILYRAYYTLAITTGLRRGELCALQWRDITGACELTVRRSRSCASGQIVESDTKSHRERIVTIPLGIWELLMALRQQQVLHSGVPDREQPIFTDPDGHVPHPDSFTRHLRKLYKKCGLSEDYHLHTLRHFYATYLLQEGTSKQVAASLLGHADTAFLERTYCHPQDVAKQQAANLMQDLLNNQNPCYVAFMKNRNRKPKKAG